MNGADQVPAIWELAFPRGEAAQKTTTQRNIEQQSATRGDKSRKNDRGPGFGAAVVQKGGQGNLSEMVTLERRPEGK